jgi:glycosyltransferase involved in cell wall biosynthesis
VRVVFVVRYLLAWRGGVQSTTHWLAVELARRGHAVAVLALDGAPEGAPLRVDRSLGYPVFAAPRTDLALAEVTASFRPDAVVVAAYHAERSDWSRSALEAAAPLPALLYIHDAGGAGLAAATGPRLAGVVAVSEFVADRIRACGGDAVVVPPIVPRVHYRVPSARRVALFVNPIPQKGLDTALALARARPDVSFAFARCWPIDPAALRDLHARARRLGNVEVRPSTGDPAELYGDARLLLAPSTYPEAWGRVAVEAQASGTPVVASALGGLPEAVDGGGMLVDPREGLEGWLRAFALLWDDPAAYARYTARARRNAERADLAASATVERFEALLRRAVKTYQRE